MGQFMNGALLGFGMALLLTPKKGEEIRQIVGERYQMLRGHAPENEALKAKIQQLTGRVQKAQNLANQAAEVGNSVQNDLEEAVDLTKANRTSNVHTSTNAPNPSGHRDNLK